MMDIESETKSLIEELADKCRSGLPITSFSVTLYDTAWVSMVFKIVDGVPHWLFPESYQYVLDTQNTGGGWGPRESLIDSIINGMAGLHALLWHQNHSDVKGGQNPLNLALRISQAENQLRSDLSKWKPELSERIGFELIAPAILEYLKGQNTVLDFPGATILSTLNRSKAERLDITVLYIDPAVPSTAIFSLEAFRGKLDYDQVGHHSHRGGMLNSPSAAAAYLISRSRWDDDAEAFLRRAVLHGAGKGSGGVPAVFPSAIFELSWVFDTEL